MLWPLSKKESAKCGSLIHICKFYFCAPLWTWIYGVRVARQRNLFEFLTLAFGGIIPFDRENGDVGTFYFLKAIFSYFFTKLCPPLVTY